MGLMQSSGAKCSNTALLSRVLIAAILINAWIFTYLTLSPRRTYQIPYTGPSNVAQQIGIPVNRTDYKGLIRPLDVFNSSSIFNTVNDALKQRNCDIHSVGVSYIPAVIPKGTRFYHAGPGSIPEREEWVAFDAEFSLNFGTRKQRRGRSSLASVNSSISNRSKNGISRSNNTKLKNEPVFMLTFETTRDLDRVIYLDGGSAAKTTSGELDTQELWSNIIAKETGDGTNDTDFFLPERLYARRICNWGKPLGLDGYIRLELGFEMVLCDFHNGIRLVDNNTISSCADYSGIPPAVSITKENGWPLSEDGRLKEDELTEDQKAVLDQEDIYDDYIWELLSGTVYDHTRTANSVDNGETRIKLDFRHMVSALNQTWLHPNPNGRRLVSEHVSGAFHELLVSQLRGVISKTDGFDARLSNDWQDMANQITRKFSPLLLSIQEDLKRSDVSAKERARRASLTYSNFIRRFHDQGRTEQESKDIAVYTYTAPKLPLYSDADFLIWSAFVDVVSNIIDTIFEISAALSPLVNATLHNDTVKNSVSIARSALRSVEGLMETLQWVDLSYRCDESCGLVGLCFTPFWGPSPFGWVVPNQKSTPNFGLRWNDEFGRYVVDEKQHCINLQTVIDNKPQ